MSASNRTILQAMLASDYEGLVRRLTRKFGSSDFAAETLHETFAKLDRLSDVTALNSPKDYLFRIAINIGKNRRRAERLRATAAEIDAVLDIPDETPDPSQITESRAEMHELVGALAELSPRVRQAFEAVLFREEPYAKIATDLGVSLRTVERDIQRATEHCAKALGRTVGGTAFSARPRT